MPDRDLAELYGVEVKQLKRQVKRNQDRFPADFV
jgi:ORF6N domain